jgi:hypothetical protein
VDLAQSFGRVQNTGDAVDLERQPMQGYAGIATITRAQPFK